MKMGDEHVPLMQFKHSCARLINRVQQTREEIIITKHGRPVAKLVAFDNVKAPLFGYLAGSVTIHGELVEPVGEEWDVDR